MKIKDELISLVSHLLIESPALADNAMNAVDGFNADIDALLTQIDEAEPEELDARNASVVDVERCKTNHANVMVGIARQALDRCEDDEAAYCGVIFDEAGQNAADAANMAEAKLDDAKSAADKGLRLASYTPETGVAAETRGKGDSAARSFTWHVEYAPAVIGARQEVDRAKAAAAEIVKSRTDHAAAYDALGTWVRDIFAA